MFVSNNNLQKVFNQLAHLLIIILSSTLLYSFIKNILAKRYIFDLDQAATLYLSGIVIGIVGIYLFFGVLYVLLKMFLKTMDKGGRL